MSDLTIAYYSASRIADGFATAVRDELLRSVAGRYPMVSVTMGELPQDWPGRKVCVGEQLGPPSIYNCYRQLLSCAKLAQTPHIAAAEDDTVYGPEHWCYRPARNVFGYDRSRWVLTRPHRHWDAFFYWRERAQLAMLIAPRELLIDALEERFARWPQWISDAEAKCCAWGEPGRYEKNQKLTLRTREYFDAAGPSVTVNHGVSLMGIRQVQPTDTICAELAPWGKAEDLWRRLHG